MMIFEVLDYFIIGQVEQTCGTKQTGGNRTRLGCCREAVGWDASIRGRPALLL